MNMVCRKIQVFNNFCPNRYSSFTVYSSEHISNRVSIWAVVNALVPMPLEFKTSIIFSCIYVKKLRRPEEVKSSRKLELKNRAFFTFVSCMPLKRLRGVGWAGSQ